MMRLSSTVHLLAMASLLLSGLMITGCQSNLDQTGLVKNLLLKHATSNSSVQQYQCDEQVVISRQKLDEDSIRLSFSNRIFELMQFSVLDKSQNFYRTEQGLIQGQGLLWVENDQSATLKIMSLDHAIQHEDSPVIYQCQLKS